MNEEKLKMYLTILNDENPSYVKENAKTNIITLFEKQQKEIENYQILKDDIEGHNIAYVDTPEFEEKYISKDKIKAKAQELDNQQRQWREDRTNKHTDAQIIYARDVLEELLGE